MCHTDLTASSWLYTSSLSIVILCPLHIHHISPPPPPPPHTHTHTHTHYTHTHYTHTHYTHTHTHTHYTLHTHTHYTHTHTHTLHITHTHTLHTRRDLSLNSHTSTTHKLTCLLPVSTGWPLQVCTWHHGLSCMLLSSAHAVKMFVTANPLVMAHNYCLNVPPPSLTPCSHARFPGQSPCCSSAEKGSLSWQWSSRRQCVLVVLWVVVTINLSWVFL